MDDINNPLQPNRARKLISEILAKGRTTFSAHAREEMRKDNILELDVVNVLRGGQIKEPAEFEKESWRYRLHTLKFCVVVSFRSLVELRVVTCWRK